MISLSTSVICLADCNYKIYFEDEEIEFDISPLYTDGEILLPVRRCFEMFDCKVTGDDEKYSVIAEKGNTKIYLLADSYEMIVNEESRMLNVCPVVINERLFVPLAPIAGVFGYDVDIDDYTVNINPFVPEQMDYKIINNGCEVALNNKLLYKHDQYYIALQDIKKINIDYIDYKRNISFSLINGPRTAMLEKSDNIIYGSNGDYPNAYLTYNNIDFVSLNALLMEYSPNYSYCIDGINISINDYTDVTYYGSVILPEKTEVPQEGFPLTVYLCYVSGTNKSSGGGFNGDISYKGIHTNIPNATNLYGEPKQMSVIEEKEIVIPYGQKTALYEINGKTRRSYSTGHGGGGSGGTGRYCIGYRIDNNIYVGGDYKEVPYCATNNTSCYYDIVAEKFDSKAYISGKIIVPEHSSSLSYTVVAEGNRKLLDNGDGSYSFHRDCTFICKNIIAENETVSNYSMLVKPYSNYDVYVVFDNGEYVRQTQSIKMYEEDVTVNLKCLEKSKTFSGKIKLPDNMDAFYDFDGEETSVSGQITLQSITEPYYYIDRFDFTLDSEKKSAEFQLFDDIGVDSAVIYYELNGNVKNVFPYGDYKDNSDIAYCLKDAATLTDSTDEMIINIPKGRTVFTTVEYENVNITEYNDIYLLPLKRNQDKVSFENSDIHLYAREIDSVFDDTVTIIYACTLPINADFYTVCYRPCDSSYYGDKITLYGNPRGFFGELEKAEEYKNTENADIWFRGYSPNVPIELIDDTEMYLDEQTGKYYKEICLWNYSDFAIENFDMYFAFYDHDDKLICLTKEHDTIEAHGKLWKDIYFEKEDADSAEYIKCFIWQENLNPVSLPVYIKTSPEKMFLMLCNSGEVESIIQALDGNLYDYELSNKIKNLNADDKITFATRLSKFKYNSIDEFNKQIGLIFKDMFPTKPSSRHGWD